MLLQEEEDIITRDNVSKVKNLTTVLAAQKPQYILLCLSVCLSCLSRSDFGDY